MHNVLKLCLTLVGLLVALGATAAVADDWLVAKARGVVQIQVDGAWQYVAQGTSIPDGTLIRTGANGRATLARGKEWLDLKAMTMLVIHDRDGQQFTTVVQMAGQIEVEAEVRDVQHFAVDTPYLAAVVKGTHFTVTVQRGKAGVSVGRGLVQVDGNDGHTYLVPKGSAISVSKSGVVTQSGAVTTGAVTGGATGATAETGTTTLVTSVIGGQSGTDDSDSTESDDEEDSSDNPCNGNSGDSHGKGKDNTACRDD